VYNAYDTLWERYSDRITPTTVLSEDMAAIIDSYDKVISTIPQPKICVQTDHFFDGVDYYILPIEIPASEYGREIVVWNGFDHDHWYRWSILGERCSIESTQPMKGALHGKKAIYSNCNCWPKTMRAGRWAKWRHGVLLHHVYTDVMTRLGGE
jgi:hypothetical protein